MRATIGSDGIQIAGITSMSIGLQRRTKADGRVAEFRAVVDVKIERTVNAADDSLIAAFSALVDVGQATEAELTFTSGARDVCVVELEDLQIVSVTSAIVGDELREIITGAAGIVRMTTPPAGDEFERIPPLFPEE